MPYLARHFRVITYDARGNGRSDRPATASGYAHREIVADALAVLDDGRGGRAVFAGTRWARCTASGRGGYPDRVPGVVAIGSAAPYDAPRRARRDPFYDVGAAGTVEAYVRAARPAPDTATFVEFFMSRVTEPHSHQADRGRGRLGPGDLRRRCSGSPSGAPGPR